MPPRKNMPQHRSVLTRSMSHNWSLKLSEGSDAWFPRVEDDGRIEKRPGVSDGKVAFRNGKLRPARLESMKNLFDKLEMEDKECDSPEQECDYCKIAKGFFYDDRKAQEPEGVCTCSKFEAGPIARLLPRRTLSRVASCDGNICPIEVQGEEFTNSSDPVPCRVVNPTTGREWKPNRSGRIRVTLGAPRGLHCWSLTGTKHGKVVHIFGCKHADVWRYATALFNGNSGRVVFRRNDKHPSDLDIDTGGPITDRRAFYIEGSSGQGFYLTPASKDHLDVLVSDKKLSFTDNRALANRWRFED